MANVTVQGDFGIYLNLPYSSVSLLTSLVAIAGNTLVIISLIKFQRLQTVTNIFVGSLSMADIFTGLKLVVYTAINLAYFQRNQNGIPIDLTILNIYSSFIYYPLSLLNLFVVSCERYFAILYPYRYLILVTKQRCTVLTIIIWIFMLVFPSPYLLILLSHGEDKIEWMYSMRDAYVWLYLILSLPIFVTTFVIYWKIYVVVRAHLRRIVCDSVEVERKFNTTESSKTKMIFLTVGCFYFSWVPFSLTVIYGILATPSPQYGASVHILNQISRIILNLNSAVNPLIYAWVNTDFRESFLKIKNDMFTFWKKR